MSTAKSSRRFVPVTQLLGMHPALERAALMLLQSSPRHYQVELAREHISVLQGSAPNVMLLTPAPGGYHVVGPPDALLLIATCGVKRVAAEIVDAIDTETLLETAIRHWLLSGLWAIHGRVSAQELVATYMQLMELATGVRPTRHAVSRALGVNSKMVDRARRTIGNGWQ